MSYKRKVKEIKLEELPRPHYLPQSPLAEHVQGRIEVGQTRLPPIGVPSPLKVLEESQTHQGNRLSPIGKEVCP